MNPRRADSLGSQEREIHVIKPKPESQYLAWTQSTAHVQPSLHPSPAAFSPPGLTADRVSPSLSQPHPRDAFISPRAREKPGFGRGLKELGKNLPLGISFLHPPGINQPMEASQLGGRLLRVKHVEAKRLLALPRCRNCVLKGPGKGEELCLSCGPMKGPRERTFSLSPVHADVFHSNPGSFLEGSAHPQEAGESLRACKLMGNMINWEKKGVLFVLLMIFCFHYVALKQACLAS